MEIITPRLILRDFTDDDWPDVLAYQSDPRYLRYYAWTERTGEQVQNFVQMFLDHQQTEPRIKFQMAVTLKDTGKLIGNCGVRKDAPDEDNGDIGYELAPEQWGKGYATEAARALLNFGFGDMHLHRIAAYCVADNTGSAHVLEKIGMTLEGRLRDHHFYKGRYWDTMLYAVLESEWRGL